MRIAPVQKDRLSDDEDRGREVVDAKGRRSFTARPRRALIKGLSRAHRAVYRASSGRIFGSLAGMPVLLLTTTGRRSGKRKHHPAYLSP